MLLHIMCTAVFFVYFVYFFGGGLKKHIKSQQDCPIVLCKCKISYAHISLIVNFSRKTYHHFIKPETG